MRPIVFGPDGRAQVRGFHTYELTPEWKAVLLRDPCVYCRDAADTIDHIQPRALGGHRNNWDNLAPACIHCNVGKGHTPLIHFLASNRVKWLPRKKRPDPQPPPALTFKVSEVVRL